LFILLSPNPNTMERILLVDDEKDILEFLKYNLQKEGFEVKTCNNGMDAIEKAAKFLPHLILLDVMMPGMDGIETCQRLRRLPEMRETRIIFLSARGEDFSQLAAYDAGADDYVTKPIKPKVLISKLKAILRRVSEPVSETEKIEVSNLIIDRDRYLVIRNNEEMSLPRKEFELLQLLCSKPERVFTRQEIFSRIWGDDVVVGDRTIDVHIRKLREKIGEDFIQTIKGVGYKFTEK
jgi:two-component system, OmpR family, alkaline phosphatase synthesis response regulator PhoP